MVSVCLTVVLTVILCFSKFMFLLCHWHSNVIMLQYFDRVVTCQYVCNVVNVIQYV